MNATYTATLKVDSTGAVSNLEEIENAVQKSNSNLIQMRKELKDVQSELLGLEPGTKQFADLAARAGELQDQMNNVSEQIRANAAPAFESVGNQAFLLRGKFESLDLAGVGESFTALGTSIGRINFKEIQDGVTGMAKGFVDLARALLSNPIFLIGAAIAGLVVYADDLNNALDFAGRSARRLADASLAAADASHKASEAFDLEERKLRALGTSENEIAALREDLRKDEFEKLSKAFEAQQKLVERAGEIYKAHLYSSDKEEKAELLKNEVEKRDIILKRLKEITVLTLEDRKKRNDELAEQDRQADMKSEDAARRRKEMQERQAAERLAMEKKLADDILNAQQQRYEQEERIAEEIYQAGLSDEQREIDAVRNKYFELIALAEQYGMDSALLREEQEAQELAISNKYRDIEKAEEEKKRKDLEQADKEAADRKRQIQENYISAAISLNELLVATGAINAEKGFNIAKGIAIAQTTISTLQGVVNALSNNTIIPEPFGQALKTSNAIAIGLAGAANIAKIARTKYNAGGGGGGSGAGSLSISGGGSPASTALPAFNPINTQFLLNRPDQNPVSKAYVLASDVASQQEAREKTNALSTL